MNLPLYPQETPPIAKNPYQNCPNRTYETPNYPSTNYYPSPMSSYKLDFPSFSSKEEVADWLKQVE